MFGMECHADFWLTWQFRGGEIFVGLAQSRFRSYGPVAAAQHTYRIAPRLAWRALLYLGCEPRSPLLRQISPAMSTLTQLSPPVSLTVSRQSRASRSQAARWPSVPITFTPTLSSWWLLATLKVTDYDRANRVDYSSCRGQNAAQQTTVYPHRVISRRKERKCSNGKNQRGFGLVKGTEQKKKSCPVCLQWRGETRRLVACHAAVGKGHADVLFYPRSVALSSQIQPL